MPEAKAPSTKYLTPASVGARVVALEGGDDVERQALQLKAEIERDEVVGRDHHHHAEGGQEDEHRIFEARHVLALHVLPRYDDGDRGRQQNQDLGEGGEGIGDEQAVERCHAPARHRHHQKQSQDQGDDAERGDEPSRPRVFAGAAFLEHAEHEQRHGDTRQEQFRQGRDEVGKRPPTAPYPPYLAESPASRMASFNAFAVSTWPIKWFTEACMASRKGMG